MNAATTHGLLRLHDGRAYLIPLAPRAVALSALELYHAQTPGAAAAKRLLGAWLRWGPAARPLPPVRHADAGRAFAEAGLHPGVVAFLARLVGRERVHVAVSLGTPGPRRKPVLLLLSDAGRALGYAKVGVDAETDHRIRREEDVLGVLARRSLRSYDAPRVLHAGFWRGRRATVLSVPPYRTHRAPRRLGAAHLNIIDEMAGVAERWQPLAASAAWTALRSRLTAVSDAGHRLVLERGARRAAEWAGDRRMPVHFCHGDFAPWNIKSGPVVPFIYDWEDASLEGLPGYDLCHFLFQTRRLLERHDAPALYGAGLADRRVQAVLGGYLARRGVHEFPGAWLWHCYCLDWTVRLAAAAPGRASTDAAVAAFARCLAVLEDPGARRLRLAGSPGGRPSAGEAARSPWH